MYLRDRRADEQQPTMPGVLRQVQTFEHGHKIGVRRDRSSLCKERNGVQKSLLTMSSKVQQVPDEVRRRNWQEKGLTTR